MQQFGSVPIRLLLFLLMCQSGIMAGARLFAADEEPYNPIATYPLIMPGAPISALHGYTCGWRVQSARLNVLHACHGALDNLYFTSIDIYTEHSTIAAIGLQVDTLCVGDMPEERGRPRIQRIGTILSAVWLYQDYEIKAVLSTHLVVTYWTPITYITVRIYGS